MRLKILPECKADMWYSELAGMELPCLGQDEDVYWSREPGFPFCRNIVLKGDAILVDG